MPICLLSMRFMTTWLRSAEPALATLRNVVRFSAEQIYSET